MKGRQGKDSTLSAPQSPSNGAELEVLGALASPVSSADADELAEEAEAFEVLSDGLARLARVRRSRAARIKRGRARRAPVVVDELAMQQAKRDAERLGLARPEGDER